MALTNYAPEGDIYFCSVPWSNDYSHVRLYSSINEQTSDIQGRVKYHTTGYVYTSYNRRLKVDIATENMYHVNYCMYKNSSFSGARWMYCFVNDVRYLNDNTTEVTLEIDVFQTYLCGVDWKIPSCFVERATVPSEDEAYLLTPEPDFALVTTIADQSELMFENGGYVIQSTDKATQGDVVDFFLNDGWTSEAAPYVIYKGLPLGSNYYYVSNGAGLKSFLQNINKAGAAGAITSIFAIPNFGNLGLSAGNFVLNDSTMEQQNTYKATLAAPGKGSDLDGYTPKNKKLFYYPYNYCRISDFAGSYSELKYELWNGSSYNIVLKYAVSPTGDVICYPTSYLGITHNVEAGIVTTFGGLGSWSCDAYQTWLAQNTGTRALTHANTALNVASGVLNVVGAGKALKGAGKIAKVATGATKASEGVASINAMSTASEHVSQALDSLQGAVQNEAQLWSQATNASHYPDQAAGQLEPSTMLMTGCQGLRAQRICVKAEIARNIDDFFTRWGYAVDRIVNVQTANWLSSRPTFNYLKTQGAMPVSQNYTGQGTPADALKIISQVFDAGVTFWHTTDNFGDFSVNNSL